MNIKQITEITQSVLGHCMHHAGCLKCITAEMLLDSFHQCLTELSAEQLSQITAALLLEWGHNYAPDCVVCETATRMLEAFRWYENGNTRVVVIDGVKICGPEA